MSRDSFFLQLPAAFCMRKAMEGLPSPAVAAGGMSGVGAQHELAEDGGDVALSAEMAAEE